MKEDNFFQLIRKSELLINSSILITGSAIAQLIPVLLQPVLRRSVSVEYFGAYSVYMSLVGILVIISSLKYDVAIILPKKDKTAINVFSLSLIMSIFFNILLLIIILIWKSEISQFLNLPDMFSGYLLLVPLGTFLLSFYQSINNWLLRKKMFKPISLNKFIRRGSEGIVQLGLKFIRVPHFLIYGDILGHIANICSGIYQGIKSGLSIRLMSIARMKYVAGKYSEYPRYNLLPALMNACSALLPVLFINKFYSLEFTGYMDLSRLLLSVPIALVSLSVSSVMLQRITEKYNKNESVLKELASILIILSSAGAMEIIIIMLFGEDIFMLLFGSQWGYSGIIARTIVWSYALSFVVNSFYSLFISLNKIKLLSLWQTFYFLAIAALLIFKNRPFLEFLRIYVIIEIICLLSMALLLIYILKKYEKSLNRLKINDINK